MLPLSRIAPEDRSRYIIKIFSKTFQYISTPINNCFQQCCEYTGATRYRFVASDLFGNRIEGFKLGKPYCN